MGTGPQNKGKGLRNKLKKYKRACYTKNRAKDIDQIIDQSVAAKEEGKDLSVVEINHDLPGLGQFYVWETDKHCIDANAMRDHKKTREYKRRVQQLKEEKYDQDFAERAAGMTKEVLPKVGNRERGVKGESKVKEGNKMISSDSKMLDGL